jgi:hypothetical protein
MSNEIGKTCEHVVELHPGDEGEIELRFAEEGDTFQIGLAGTDPSEGTAELLLESMWGGYQMRHYVERDKYWETIWPADDGDVHAVVKFGGGPQVNISSDTARIHSIDLMDVAWRDGVVRLSFRESA